MEPGTFSLSEDFKSEVLKSLDWRIPLNEVQNLPLYRQICQLVTDSDPYALLFNDRAVAELAAAAVTDTKKTMSPSALKLFLELVSGPGYIYAFEHTPLPGAPLRENLSQDDLDEILTIRELSASAQRKGAKDSQQRCFSTIFSKYGQYAERSLEEINTFAQKIVTALTNDDKAYELLSDAGFTYPEWMAGIAERLAIEKKEGMDYLLQEAKTKQPQRGNYLQRKDEASQLSPVYLTDPCRGEFSHPSLGLYTVEMERSLVGVINALCDREERDNHLTEYCEGIKSIVSALSTPEDQFLSVYQVDGKKHMGTVWLKGLRYKDKGALEYYDEIGVDGREKALEPLRKQLLGFVNELATRCGYQKVIFDSDGIIQGPGGQP